MTGVAAAPVPVPAAVLAAALAGALLVAGCSTSGAAPRAHATRATRATESSSPAATNSPAGTPATPAAPSRLRVHPMPWRLPQPLAREALVPRGTRSVLVAGGLLSGDRSSAATYLLRLDHGTVTRLPDLTTPVHDVAGASQGATALVVGGGGSVEESVVQERSTGAWRPAGRLPTPRSDLSAVTVGREVYVLGGYDGRSVALGDVLVSRTGRHWRVAGRLPVPVRYAAVARVGAAIWVIGGERAGVMVDAVQRVDLRTGRAELVGHLPRPVGHAAVLVLAGRMLLAGGRTSADRLTDRLWWVRGGRVTPAGRLPHPLADSAVAARGPHTAYLVGGETPAPSDRVLRVTYGP